MSEELQIILVGVVGFLPILWMFIRDLRRDFGQPTKSEERPYPWPKPNCASCNAYQRGYRDGYNDACGEFGAMVDDDWD